MHRLLPLALLALFLNSCIPLRIAPNIKDYKVTKGKRFKRGLPKKNMFVFEDPKEANEFYNYINTKFGLEDYYVDVQVPFSIEGRSHYLSFYEVEIKDKSINLAPLMFDVVLNAALGYEDFEPITANDANSLLRKGNYYIAIEVFSDDEDDCLSEKYSHQKAVLAYLGALKKEYLSINNYNDAVFKD